MPEYFFPSQPVINAFATNIGNQLVRNAIDLGDVYADKLRTERATIYTGSAMTPKAPVNRLSTSAIGMSEPFWADVPVVYVVWPIPGQDAVPTEFACEEYQKAIRDVAASKAAAQAAQEAASDSAQAAASTLKVAEGMEARLAFTDVGRLVGPDGKIKPEYTHGAAVTWAADGTPSLTAADGSVVQMLTRSYVDTVVAGVTAVTPTAGKAAAYLPAGQLAAATPTSDSHAVNLAYFNEKVAGRVTSAMASTLAGVNVDVIGKADGKYYFTNGTVYSATARPTWATITFYGSVDPSPTGLNLMQVGDKWSDTEAVS